jgi:hypothetical protein
MFAATAAKVSIARHARNPRRKGLAIPGPAPEITTLTYNA